MSVVSNKPLVCPVLIGRQVELASLLVLIDQARSGRGQLVLVSGEAGIGKSRLAAEAKTQAQGFLVLQGSCFPTDRSSPYAPLLDLPSRPARSCANASRSKTLSGTATASAVSVAGPRAARR